MKKLSEQKIDFLINKYLTEACSKLDEECGREEIADYEIDEKLELLLDDEEENENTEDEDNLDEGVNVMTMAPEMREAFKRMVNVFLQKGMSRDAAEKVALGRIKGSAII